MNCRQKIKKDFKGFSEKDIKFVIMEAMHDRNEDHLQSLGVLFEYVWKDANPMERKQIIKIIKNNI